MQVAPSVRSLREILSEQKSSNFSTYFEQRMSCFLERVLVPCVVTEVFGEAGTGKTQLCMQISASGASECDSRESVIYIDTEGTFRPERLLQMTNQMSDSNLLAKINYLYASSPKALEQVLLRIVLRQYSFVPRMLILDSIAGASRFYFDKFTELKLHLLRIKAFLQQIASEFLIPVVITNQVGDVISSGKYSEMSVHSSFKAGPLRSVFCSYVGSTCSIQLKLQKMHTTTATGHQEDKCKRLMSVTRQDTTNSEIRDQTLYYYISQKGLQSA